MNPKRCLTLILALAVATIGMAEQSIARTIPSDSKWGFLENQGQWPSDALFRTNASGFSLKFQQDGVAFLSSRELENEDEEWEDEEEHEEDEIYEYYVWKMRFSGGNPSAKVEKGEVIAARTNFFLGDDPSKWLTKVPEYDELIYREVWKGIDVRFFLEANGALKYEFLLVPGADPEEIRIEFEGLNGIEVLRGGELRLDHPWGPVTEKAPVAYGEGDGRDIPVRFVRKSATSYGFEVQNRPEGETWVIDPLLMYWGSFLNVSAATSINYSHDIGYDLKGCLYLTGRADASFPATPGSYQSTIADAMDGFVAKIAPDGSTVLAMTYLGGTSPTALGVDYGWSISVSPSGRVYVCGETNAINFPTTPGALASSTAFGFKPWIASFDSSLSVLHYSTMACANCLGAARAITHVSGNEAIIAGYSEAGSPFTASPGAFMATPPGGQSVWVMRLSATGGNMAWGTLFGTSGNDFVNDITTNDLEEPFFVGHTTGSTLPFTPGVFGGTIATGAYVTRMNATGSGLVYCSSFGKGYSGQLWGVDVLRSTGEAFVAGYEVPSSIASTTPGAFQVTSGGGTEATVGRISADGSSLVYLTYLGGTNTDQALGIAVASSGEAFVSGVTNSPNFPTSGCQLQPSYSASLDMFLTHLNGSGTALGKGGSAYYGGTADDYFLPKVSIRQDGAFDTLFCSLTTHSANFPTTPNGFQPVKLNGIGDCPVAFKLVAFDQELLLDTLSCATSSYLAQAPTLAANILWSNGDTAASTLITQSGQYWLSSTLYGCPFTDTFEVVINTLSLDLGPDTTICTTQAINLPLSAGTGDAWLWSNQDTTPSIILTSPGTYWVTATDTQTGCTATDTLLVQSVPPPQLNLSPPPLCQGGSVPLSADPSNNYPGATYLWSTGDTSAQITVGSPGLYWVELTHAQGCSSRDSVTLVLNPLPMVDLGPDTTLCSLPSIDLNAGGGYAGYLWSDNSTGPSATISQPGWAWVEVTDSNGCSNRDSLLIRVGTLPVPILGPDTSLCAGESVTLSPQYGGPGHAFAWSNGDSTATITVNQSGLYWVQVTELSSGCSNRDSAQVIVFPDPNPIFPPDTLVCEVDSLLLAPGTFDDYLWSDGSSLPSLVVTQPGQYAVTVTNGHCVDSARVSVAFGVLPDPDLGPDLDLCLEDPRVLHLLPLPGATVLWSDGSTGWSIEFEETGDYWAEVANACGRVRDSIRVNYAQEFVEPLLPNVFSPNGDGVNDCFRVENPSVEPYLVQVFDRWGSLMHVARSPADCWDGNFRDAPAPEGVYFYLARIRACNGELVSRVVNLSLLR